MADRLLLASGNPGKLTELRRLLGQAGIEVIVPADLRLRLEIEETGSTFEENAILKAEAAAKASGLPALADDSGLEIEALDGKPGVRSARFAGPQANDQDRVRLVLELLSGVPPDRRAARFVSAVALAGPEERTVVFRGTVEGVIADQPWGEHGFGYDPIFFYPPLGRTFAELTRDEKAEVSHRGRALRQAVEFILRSR